MRMERGSQQLVQTTTWSLVGQYSNTRTSIKPLKFRHSLLAVRVRRGADAGSDHHLLTAKIQLKLKWMKHREERVKFNTQQFQDIGTSELYKVALHNRYQALEIETPSKVEEIWKGLKTLWKDTCKVVVGRRKTESKPCYPEIQIAK